MGDIEDNIHAEITKRGNVDVFGVSDLEALAGENGLVRSIDIDSPFPFEGRR